MIPGDMRWDLISIYCKQARRLASLDLTRSSALVGVGPDGAHAGNRGREFAG
jgi:hypothetical protein